MVSHAHVDHYGGIEGLIAPEEVADRSLPLDEQLASGKTAIIVPKGYADAVMKENVFVGTAMKRRAGFHFSRAGVLLRPAGVLSAEVPPLSAGHPQKFAARTSLARHWRTTVLHRSL